MANAQTTTKTAPVQQTTTTQNQSTSTQGGEKKVQRDALRGASYEEGAALLSPNTNVQLKQERGVTTGAPVQMDGKKPVVKPDANGEVKGKTPTGGNDKPNTYSVNPAQPENGGKVIGTGAGWGNRKGDNLAPVDEKDPSKGEKIKNSEVKLETVTGIPTPKTDKLPTTYKKETEGAYGTYTSTEVKSGQVKGASGEVTPDKYKVGEGGTIKGPNAYMQGGVTGKTAAGIKGKAENDYGSIEGKTEAYGEAYAAYSGEAGLSNKGGKAEFIAGAGGQAGVTADADAKTKGVKVDGVEKDLDAGVGVHGEAQVYAKAGGQAGVYATKDKMGIELKGGAAIAAEAKADIHGNIGPVSGKAEVGVLAGAGIGGEFAIVYEDGKLRIGARAYAALGYGVSMGGEIEIDLKQSYQLAVAVLKKAKEIGVKGAEMAFKAADADNDGKLTLNDGATHMSNAMQGTANAIDKGADATISALDRDGDGKFSMSKDGGAALNQAGEYISEKAGQAKDYVVEKGKQVVEGTKNALDMNGDKQLGLDDISAGYEKGKAWTEEKINQAGEAIHKTADDVMAWGGQQIDNAIVAAQQTHKFLDRTGDGKLGMDDVTKGAGEVYNTTSKAVGQAVDWTKEKGGQAVAWAKEKGGQAVDWAKEKGGQAVDWAKDKAKQTGKALHNAADRDGDGKLGMGDVKAGIEQAGQAIDNTLQAAKQTLQNGYEAAKNKVHQVGQAVYKAADLNKDGKIDSKDAALAAKKAQQAAAWAKQKALAAAAAAWKKGQAVYAAMKAKAQQVKQSVKAAMDRNGDGKIDAADLKAGAKQAYQKAVQVKNAVVNGAKSAYQATTAALSKAGQTLSNGYQKATATLGNTYNKLKNFFWG